MGGRVATLQVEGERAGLLLRQQLPLHVGILEVDSQRFLQRLNLQNPAKLKFGFISY